MKKAEKRFKDTGWKQAYFRLIFSPASSTRAKLAALAAPAIGIGAAVTEVAPLYGAPDNFVAAALIGYSASKVVEFRYFKTHDRTEPLRWKEAKALFYASQREQAWVLSLSRWWKLLAATSIATDLVPVLGSLDNIPVAVLTGYTVFRINTIRHLPQSADRPLEEA